jgi:hypothetical protein
MSRKGWWVAAGLVALSAFPVLAGALRLHTVVSGAPVTAENARFLAAPVPIVLHIVGASLFTLLGAFQFVPQLRTRRSGWHRRLGGVLGGAGLVAALSGVWMTLLYPRAPGDGALLDALRLLFGGAMAVSLVLGVVAIRRRDLPAHEAWMTRAYAIGLGAGTQVLTHLPFAFLVGGQPGVLTRAVLLGLGWVINLAVAEWVIARRRSPLPRSPADLARGWPAARTAP